MTTANTSRVYLDHNATTPVDKELQREVVKWLDLFGNPSSIHFDGRGPKQLMREARQKLAELVGCHPLEIVFTSGGSEANSLAVLGAARSIRKKTPQKNKIIISSVEHSSLLKTAEQLEQEGFEVLRLRSDRQGRLDLDQLKANLNETVALVSLMYANNETGVIHPVAEVCELAHKFGVKVHSDGVQIIGKANINLQTLAVDYMSFSGHKFYGLKGSGFLFIRAQSPIEPLIAGGGQERRRRAGTENVLGIAAMGFMAKKFLANPEVLEYTQTLRDSFEIFAKAKISDVTIIGEESIRLPNTSSLVIKGISGESLLMNLDVQGFSVSTGAACSSGNPEPSPALLAMGYTFREAQSSLRVSFGKDNTAADVERFCFALEAVVKRLRGLDNPEFPDNVTPPMSEAL
jgi:cysteine desulfurase